MGAFVNREALVQSRSIGECVIIFFGVIREASVFTGASLLYG